MASLPTYEYFLLSSPTPTVVHVQINRPQKLNAFIPPMWHELRQVFTHLSTLSTCRAILLSGAGDRAFTAGLDVQSATTSGPLASTPSDTSDPARKATSIRRHILDFQACITAVENCEKPVICVLHGHSLGLAIDLSLCADIRLCTSTTRFAVKEVDIGIAADIGTLSRLPKAVGSASWVKDVCLTARIFGAEEALHQGLVSSVWEGKEAAVDEGVRVAGLMASKSPVAVQGTKELLNYSRDHTVEEGLRYTAVWNGAALQTGDTARAMGEKNPRFEKL